MKHLFLLPALIAGLGLLTAGRMTAQTFTTLHSFDGSDQAIPQQGVILSGNTLYGTTTGSYSNGGTVFAVNTNGTGFTILHTFPVSPPLINSDGRKPVGELILWGNTLYGTTSAGGSSGNGTVFAVNTDGTGFTTLYSFTAGSGPSPSTNSDGAKPRAGLILSGTTLYGTASLGGSSGAGTVFAIDTDDNSFTTLHSFTATNSEGANPEEAGLILSGNTLYGTTANGGSSGRGTVFKVNTDGTGFTTLHSFTATPDSHPLINSDGASLEGDLLLSGNTLYGTALTGGSGGRGTIFKVNTDGTGFTNLHSFSATSGSYPSPSINSDGAAPWAGLIISGSTLYGTATHGGSSGAGTVFSVNTDGTGFTTLHSFTTSPVYSFPPINSGGSEPEARLILSGNTLYGTASYGGSWGWGTVFSLSLPPPQLTIARSGTNVILTWPASAAGFTLQFTPDLVPPAAWSPVSQEPSVVDGRNEVTDPIFGTRKFYRLSQ